MAARLCLDWPLALVLRSGLALCFVLFDWTPVCPGLVLATLGFCGGQLGSGFAVDSWAGVCLSQRGQTRGAAGCLTGASLPARGCLYCLGVYDALQFALLCAWVVGVGEGCGGPPIEGGFGEFLFLGWRLDPPASLLHSLHCMLSPLGGLVPTLSPLHPLLPWTLAVSV